MKLTTFFNAHFPLPMNRNAEHRLGVLKLWTAIRAEPVLGVPTLRFMAPMRVRWSVA